MEFIPKSKRTRKITAEELTVLTEDLNGPDSVNIIISCTHAQALALDEYEYASLEDKSMIPARTIFDEIVGDAVRQMLDEMLERYPQKPSELCKYLDENPHIRQRLREKNGI